MSTSRYVIDWRAQLTSCITIETEGTLFKAIDGRGVEIGRGTDFSTLFNLTITYLASHNGGKIFGKGRGETWTVNSRITVTSLPVDFECEATLFMAANLNDSMTILLNGVDRAYWRLRLDGNKANQGGVGAANDFVHMDNCDDTEVWVNSQNVYYEDVSVHSSNTKIRLHIVSEGNGGHATGTPLYVSGATSFELWAKMVNCDKQAVYWAGAEGTIHSLWVYDAGYAGLDIRAGSIVKAENIHIDLTTSQGAIIVYAGAWLQANNVYWSNIAATRYGLDNLGVCVINNLIVVENSGVNNSPVLFTEGGSDHLEVNNFVISGIGNGGTGIYVQNNSLGKHRFTNGKMAGAAGSCGITDLKQDSVFTGISCVGCATPIGTGSICAELEIADLTDFDLSAAAAVHMLWHCNRAAVLLGYTVTYTELSSADAGVHIHVGMMNAGAAWDEDYFDVITTQASKAAGYTDTLKTGDLTLKVISAGDMVGASCGGSKTGTGNVRLVLKVQYID